MKRLNLLSLFIMLCILSTEKAYTKQITSGNDLISSFPYSESFESGLGMWEQSDNDDISWLRHRGAANSKKSGPDQAHEGKYYFYIESSKQNTPAKSAALVSKFFDFSELRSPTLTFWYHMDGAKMGSLIVAIKEEGGTGYANVWSVAGDQGKEWQVAELDLRKYFGKKISVRFTAITGDRKKSDIAIDAISVKGMPREKNCEKPHLSFVKTDVGCRGENTGSAMVLANGGKLPYSFEWSNGSNLETITHLPAGLYTITVTDAKECSAEASVFIDRDNPISATFRVYHSILDNVSDGQIDLKVSGGAPPYSFEWMDGIQTEDRKDLPAGDYSVRITDSQGCRIKVHTTVGKSVPRA